MSLKLWDKAVRLCRLIFRLPLYACSPLYIRPGALNHVISLRENSVVPNEKDLHGAAIALVRLQDTYRLNVSDLAEGHFTGVDHSKERGK